MKEILEKNTWTVSVVGAILIGYALGFLSVYYFKEYGWTVFVLVPFYLGLISSLIYGNTKEMSRKEAIKIGLSTLAIFCATTLLFVIEGIICVIMASPILTLCTLLGTLLGYWLIKNRKANRNKAYSLFLFPMLFISVDSAISTKEHLEVKTVIEIDAPIEKVWHNIVTFGRIDEPDEWIFKTGIAYPIDAGIEGEGVGAVRYCNFTTGSFVEPITVWQEPNLLKFDVLDQPEPMRELNPFWDVHPPHLDGYFQSKKGEFKLTQLDNGLVKVEETTWYNIHIHPVAYWDLWSKFILHKIHFRVLKHIKRQSEK